MIKVERREGEPLKNFLVRQKTAILDYYEKEDEKLIEILKFMDLHEN
jgi:predicted Zn-dependent protease with MMP-like domain